MGVGNFIWEPTLSGARSVMSGCNNDKRSLS